MKYLPALFLGVAALGAADLPPAPPPFEASLQSRAGFDSNPLGTSGTSAAILGREDTLTYSAGAGLGLTLPSTTPKTTSLKLTYAFEAVRFDHFESEDFATHKFGSVGKFTAGAWTFTGDISSLFVDGDQDTLTSVASANANGVTLWRERRQQWQHRAKLQTQALFGSTLVRAGAKLLAYDYQTDVAAGKVAFADRSDTQASLDLGWKQGADSLWLAGVRAGYQRQATVPLPGCSFEYSNTYSRLAAGWEGKPFSGTTVTFAAGPDFRRYTGAVDPAVFTGGRNRTSLWFEGGFTSKLSDTVTLTGKAARMPWLSSTGKSAYTDTCGETAVSWAPTPALSLQFVAKLHRCDYFPVKRDDWESFIGPGATLKLSKHTVLTLDVLRQDAWNTLSGSSQREFHRVVVNLGVTVKL
ncbi:MAG: hypothetical protein WC661_21220 [Opitutaceae bacterium]|jgi:hypothetical protein